MGVAGQWVSFLQANGSTKLKDTTSLVAVLSPEVASTGNHIKAKSGCKALVEDFSQRWTGKLKGGQQVTLSYIDSAVVATYQYTAASADGTELDAKTAEAVKLAGAAAGFSLTAEGGSKMVRASRLQTLAFNSSAF